MKLADRVEFNATGTSAAVITVGAATLGMRTPAQAIASGEFSATETNVPFVVKDAAGNWESARYTLSNGGATLTQTARLNSSNSGAAVTFNGSTLTVTNAETAADLNAGLINPYDPGFDIILLLGQSNMVGQDVPTAALDIVDSRIFSYGCFTNEAATYRKITQAVDPLRHNYNAASLPGTGNGSGLGPGSWLARTYAGMIPSNRKVLLVPCARSATKLFADTREWFPGDGTVGSGVALGAAGSTLLDNAIDQATRAVAEAQLMYPNSRVVGIAWHQGEGDADWFGANLQLNYTGAQKTLIQAIRTRVPTASKAWVVIGGLMGENVADTAGHPGYQAVDNAHRTVAAEVPRCAYTPGLTGYKMGDNLHYTAAGQRILGCNMASAIPAAIASKGNDTTAPVTRSATVYAADTFTVAWAVSEPVDPNFVPAASAFAVTGHTASSVRVQGNYIYVTFTQAFVNGEAARTLTYTASAAGSNGLRDLAGNVMADASQSVTNNVPAAPSVTSVTVSPSAPSVAGSATQQFTATVTGTGSPAQTVTWSATAGTIDSSGLFTAPAATGSTQTITVTATSTVDGTKSGTATVTVAATGGTATVSSVTVSPSTASVAGAATQQFTATVTGTNSPAQTVTWSTTAGTVNSSGLFTAPAATGSTQTITVTATSTVDNSKSGTATVTVAAAASSTDLQFADFYLMTDTSVGGPGVAPYTYKMGSSVNYGATQQGGTAVKSLAGDGTFTVKLVTVSARQFIGLKTTAPTTNYGSLTALFMAETTGYKLYFPDGNSTTYVTNRIPAENDLVRMTRSGTNVTYAVSSDGGSTWTDIAKQANVAAGTKYLQILGQSNGQFVGPVGTGFA